MRHTNITEVNAHLENNTLAIEKFNGWLKDADFQRGLEKAISDPNSTEAKRILEEAYPTFNISSGALPRYGPRRQQFVVTSLINYLRFFSYPSLFITISPGDAELLLGLKLSISTTQINTFAETDWQLDNEMSTVNINLDLSSAERNRFIQSNAHFYAMAFALLVELFFQSLLGIPINKASLRKTVPFSDPSTGIFGRVSAAYVVIEGQQRDSLHAYSLIFGGVLYCH